MPTAVMASGAGSASSAASPPAIAATIPTTMAPKVQQGPYVIRTMSMSVAQVDSVHIAIDEKFNAVLNRDGGVESLEVKGELMLRVTDPEKARVQVAMAPVSDSAVQFKVFSTGRFGFL